MARMRRSFRGVNCSPSVFPVNQIYPLFTTFNVNQGVFRLHKGVRMGGVWEDQTITSGRRPWHL